MPKSPKFSPKPNVRAKGKRPTLAAKGKKRRYNRPHFVAIGIDISTYSIAGAAGLVDKDFSINRVSTHTVRWQKEDHYFHRMVDAARAHDFIHELLIGVKALADLDQVHIAMEEPWPPFSMSRRSSFQSTTLKQQAQISGAFMGGLLRYGYTNVYEIHNTWWRQIVAADLGITIHHTKWNPNKVEGKFRAKEWVAKCRSHYGIPEFPDLIEDAKRGLIPRPEGRKARAAQSDDRYEAVAMMEWVVADFKKGEGNG